MRALVKPLMVFGFMGAAAVAVPGGASAFGPGFTFGFGVPYYGYYRYPFYRGAYGYPAYWGAYWRPRYFGYRPYYWRPYSYGFYGYRPYWGYRRYGYRPHWGYRRYGWYGYRPYWRRNYRL
jgi:hypothetical protein